jgi:tRNA A-37 threonylcarbamoyl transferase component Bud32
MEPIATGRFSDGRSALLTLGITDYERASDKLPKLSGNEKRQLILAIAELAGKMHAAKFAHQDFYLVHLFVKETADSGETTSAKLFQVLPIDLQRIIIGPRFSRRWRVKDLGQLLYSALDCTDDDDRELFWRRYTEIAGEHLRRDEKLIRSILKKADAIRRRSLRKKQSSK